MESCIIMQEDWEKSTLQTPPVALTIKMLIRLLQNTLECACFSTVDMPSPTNVFVGGCKHDSLLLASKMVIYAVDHKGCPQPWLSAC